MGEDDLDNEVDSIIDQLKNQNNSLRKVEKEYPNLKPEDVDDFIIKYASRMIVDASETLTEQMEIVKAGGTPQDVEAAAAFLNAFNSTVEILQKRKIADNKNKTQKEVTQMNIEAKQISDENKNDTPKALMSREELLRFLTGPKEEEEEDDAVDV